ncbi:hypothetical protein PpBr36_08409 [Pyricularia pennisetigena]|uniref:hypothetical protein n=1 Tax=Pyricularia pennisetigena TaxID=1578925 RepID=UPI0011531C63|nr:hypothetical protein PpBr36_08409 [Pyricularia pennisetigena]TLS24911.1 hypothetical protein PpBr36_08409 [Pyricularia pennisetigena]
MMQSRLARISGLRTLRSISRCEWVQPLQTRHASSFSAIHDGLRRSEKARPQGFNRSSLTSASLTKRSQGGRGRRANDDKPPPTFKIRKGKKDISKPRKHKPMTRAARFNDPNNDFGKKSLVYQVKSGQLRNDMAALPGKKSNSAASPGDIWDNLERASAAQSMGRKSRTRKSAFGSEPQRRSRPVASTFTRASSGRSDESSDFVKAASRPLRDEEVSFRQPEKLREPESRMANFRSGNENSYDTERPRSDDHKRTEPKRWSEESSDFRTNNYTRPSSYTSSRGYDDRLDPTVTSIPYTTAASQFLYGRSVVEETLRSSRRKLYHLYIYDGLNRSRNPNDMVIEKLAQKRGVRITKLDEGHQRLMSKMSEGRPHNNFVLEASPVPQPPIEALGSVSEEVSRPGFEVSLGHQTAEDLAINGCSNFVETEGGKYQPLVLLLDRILDPGNLGSILRTASFLGVSAVVISQRNSATLTPVALKAAAGASETLPLFSCDNPASFLHNSKESGWKIYAAVAPSRSRKKSEQDVYDIEDLDPLATDPCVLVVGSEGEGLPTMIKTKSHHSVTIPNSSGAHTIDSLNVSVAAGLLCGAFLKGVMKQKHPRPFGGSQKSDEMGFW